MTKTLPWLKNLIKAIIRFRVQGSSLYSLMWFTKPFYILTYLEIKYTTYNKLMNRLINLNSINFLLKAIFFISYIAGGRTHILKHSKKLIMFFFHQKCNKQFVFPFLFKLITIFCLTRTSIIGELTPDAFPCSISCCLSNGIIFHYSSGEFGLGFWYRSAWKNVFKTLF